jgi:hypothetical protein
MASKTSLRQLEPDGHWHRAFAWWQRRHTFVRGALRKALLRVVYTVAADSFNHRVCANLVERIRQYAGIVDILMPSAAQA